MVKRKQRAVKKGITGDNRTSNVSDIPRKNRSTRKKNTNDARKGYIVLLILVVGIIALVVFILVRYNSLDEGYDGFIDDKPTPTEDGFGTIHGIGSSDEDFWTKYPAGHENAGESVSYPTWIREENSSKVLLILVHSKTCSPCKTQSADINDILDDPIYASNVTYLDLLASGSDDRARQSFSAFDPNGKENYIPLTVIVVKHRDGGYLWHSWEGVTGKANLESWLDDALKYRGGGDLL